MNDEKWTETVYLIKEKFGIIEKTEEEKFIGDDFSQNKAKEKIETVIFKGPLGKMKIERITRPLILEKKVHYTKREGQGAQIEITYSEDEFTHKLKVYRWEDLENNWVELETKNLNFS